MLRQIIAMFFVVVIYTSVKSQDIHYTQFFNSPLTLNPALTGLTRGSYRVGAAYRTQWFGAANTNFANSPYSTPSVFFDIPITVNSNDDAVGFGGLFISDQTGANTFSAFTGCLSASFIKRLGVKKDHQLSGGLQLGLTYKSINTEGLQFESQFVGTTFYQSLGSNEPFERQNQALLNLNAGLVWLGRINRRFSMYAGGSVYNVTQPNSSFLVDGKTPWYLRWNAHAGLDITLGRPVHLLPNIMYMHQGTANQFLPGITIAYDVTPVATISLGSLTRVNDLTSKEIGVDATALYGAFDYKGFKMGVSYDFTVSKLRQAKPGLGAFEVTIIYIGKSKKNNKVIFCPLF